MAAAPCAFPLPGTVVASSRRDRRRARDGDWCHAYGGGTAAGLAAARRPHDRIVYTASMAHEQLSIRTRDGVCPAHLFTPATSGAWPAVIFYMDGLGVR